MDRNPAGKWPLPNLVVTSSGHAFDPRASRWQWRGPLHTVSVGFEAFRRRAPTLTPSIMSLLAWVAERGPDVAVSNNHSRLTHFFKYCAPDADCVSQISQREILNFHASPAAKNGQLAAISGLLKLWFELEIPGVTADAYGLLQRLRLTGNVKGRAVRTMDPFDGPLTDLEREAMLVRLGDAYAAGQVSFEDYVLGLVFCSLAPRPIQAAALKVKDLVFESSSSGLSKFRIEVPRAKQRGEPPRTSFTTRVLTQDLGTLLKAHADAVTERFKHEFDDPAEIPLFPATGPGGDEPEAFRLHYVAKAMGARVTKLLTDLGVTSERTIGTLKANSSRLRRTLGTNAAKEGHGALVIAALLDHTDTQNVSPYTEACPEFIEHLDRTMAFQLAKLAQAFSGMLIPDETSALRAGDDESLIMGPEQVGNFDGLGNCGSFSFCALAAPLACYTCRNFQPWLEAPHEAVLEWLLKERERLVAVGDLRIASVRDRTILAVASVVTACLECAEGAGD